MKNSWYIRISRFATLMLHRYYSKYHSLEWFVYIWKAPTAKAATTVARRDEHIERGAAEVRFEEADALAAEDPELEALEAELDDALLELEMELEMVLDRFVEAVLLEALMLV